MASVNSPAPTANSPNPTGAQGGEYPEQRHAGAVGYGPEYARGVTTGDKLEGFKEEAKGKILRKPDLVQHGKELRTGELKKKKEEEDQSPFQTADADDNRAGASSDSLPKNDENAPTSMPPGVHDTSHPTEQGRMQQAATVAPEGTDDARSQSAGEHDYHNIG